MDSGDHSALMVSGDHSAPMVNGDHSMLLVSGDRSRFMITCDQLLLNNIFDRIADLFIKSFDIPTAILKSIVKSF